MDPRPSYKITSHPLGSTREVWAISWPLILGFTCNGLMIIVDRLILARYSLSSLNAATAASSAAFSFLMVPMAIASISEVFVGRFNGHNLSKQIGSSVWQMIWFSFLILPLLIILGKIFGPRLLGDMAQGLEALSYFNVIVNFGFIFCINQALAGFFVGQGKVIKITACMAFSNLINVALDYALIYGTAISPPLGTKGAAIATILSQCILASALFLFFINKTNRDDKGTGEYKLNKELLIESIYIGAPASFAHLSEGICFFIFIKLMSRQSENYLTISVLLNTLYMIFYFIIEGFSKGVTAICSNFIGASKLDYIKKNFVAALKAHSILAAIITFVVLTYSSNIFSLFINAEHLTSINQETFLDQIKKPCLYICLIYFINGITWIIIGILTASLDTKFIMYTGVLTPLLLFLLPVYFCIHYFNITIDQVWLIIAICCIISLCIYFYRYKSNASKKFSYKNFNSNPIKP